MQEKWNISVTAIRSAQPSPVPRSLTVTAGRTVCSTEAPTPWANGWLNVLRWVIVKVRMLTISPSPFTQHLWLFEILQFWMPRLLKLRYHFIWKQNTVLADDNFGTKWLPKIHPLLPMGKKASSHLILGKRFLHLNTASLFFLHANNSHKLNFVQTFLCERGEFRSEHFTSEPPAFVCHLFVTQPLCRDLLSVIHETKNYLLCDRISVITITKCY